MTLDTPILVHCTTCTYDSYATDQYRCINWLAGNCYGLNKDQRRVEQRSKAVKCASVKVRDSGKASAAAVPWVAESSARLSGDYCAKSHLDRTESLTPRNVQNTCCYFP
ncbi:unnamed protein product, partial [Iphiclides podalirius]